MCKLVCLNEIEVGERATVKSINTSCKIKRRLLDVGLIDGTVVECVGKAPCGEPSAFLIRGAVIAMRDEDCLDILAKRMPKEDA